MYHSSTDCWTPSGLLLGFLERRLPERANRCREVARRAGRLRARADISPEVVRRMLRNVEELVELACWIRHHHERWDGHGDPELVEVLAAVVETEPTPKV